MKLSFVLPLLLLAAPVFARAQAADLPVFSVAPGQVYQASVTVKAEGNCSLEMNLVPEKRMEFAEFTRRYLNQKVRIVADGQNLVEPIIKNQILGGQVSVPCSSPEAGLVLGKKLVSR